MKKRKSLSSLRFGVVIVFFMVGLFGLYKGLGNLLTEPSSLSWTLPLQGEVIVLDAGHGGVDPGSVSKSGVLEKDINLQVANKLRDLLQQGGAHVIMIRDSDKDLAPDGMKGYSRRKSADLKARATLVQEADANLLISLHCNALPATQWSGPQTFYNSKLDASKQVATEIQATLQQEVGTDRTVKQLNDNYLLKQAKIPGALVELGFLSNPQEAEQLTQAKHQDLLALSIYKGILAYYAEEKKS